MATLYWVTGSTDIDVGFAGHADNDTLIVDRGGDRPTANLNKSARDYAALRFNPGSAAQFGTEDEPFTFDCDQAGAGLVWNAGQGDLRLAAGTGNTHARTVHRPARAGAAMVHGVGTYTLVEVAAGRYRAISSAVLTTLWVLAPGSAFLAYNATALTTAYVGGPLTSDRVITTSHVMQGGELTQGKGDQTWATVNVNGGIFRPKGGTITTLNAHAGVVDFSQLERDLTLTNSVFSAGVRFIPAPGNAGGGGPRVIVTNAPTIRGGLPAGYNL